MKNNHNILFAKSTKGIIVQWEIWSEDQYIFMEYGKVGGETQLDQEHVPLGLASRTLDEQILARINSRINKKIDSGYVFSIERARNNERTNSLGYKRPTKCLAWNKVKVFPFSETYCQTKLDGHHCNIVNDCGELIAYSSNGKIIETIPEILSSIKIPIGVTIEGELYHHGTILQTISSWVRRRQENTKLLKFVIYECDIKSDCYSERLEWMKENVKISSYDYAEIHETKMIVGNFDVLKMIKEEVSKGFEGLILRTKGYAFESFKRTIACIKVKPIHFTGEFAIEDEFLIVDILSSKDGFARLKCDNGKGKTFMVLCHGTHEYKTNILKNKKDYIHKHVNIEFSGFTKSKIPQHPVSKRFREKFEE